jgi:hypothetical protein
VAPTICSYRGGQPRGLVLPDPVCTPGVADPSVTQANIHQTICVAGYSTRVRPSTSYTSPLKTRQMTLYGDVDLASNYEEDHLISLELGGSPTDPRNLWPEYPASPNSKDRLEDRLHTLVCADQLALTDAQRAIANDWIAAYRQFIGREPSR